MTSPFAPSSLSARTLLRGALAGAAGTTALNAATYVDMVIRGRGASSTPEQTVEAAADRVGVEIPGDEETAGNRVAGLGPLLGIAAGVGAGTVTGLLYAAWRPPVVVGAALAGVVAMAAGSGPMAALAVSDPRQWSASDWISDALPHVAYGLTTAAVLDLTA